MIKEILMKNRTIRDMYLYDKYNGNIYVLI